MTLRAVGRALSGAMFLLFACACFQFTEGTLDEEKDPHYIEGQKKVNAMDYEGAIESFERALQANPRSSAAHLALGILYEERKNNYSYAIYHYQRHLQLNPKSSMADVVAGRITTCKRELAKTVSIALVSREVQRDLERLTSTNAALRERILFLENELHRRPRFITNFVTNWLTVTQVVTRTVEVPVQHQLQTQQQPGPRISGATTTNRVSADPPARPSQVSGTTSADASRAKRNYTVRAGDTFTKIARQHGITLQALQRANPRVSASRIKPGQVVVIPPK